MSVAHRKLTPDRKVSLALSHARFTMAADMLRWALNAEIDAADRAEVLETVRTIEGWAKDAFDRLTERTGSPSHGR